MLCILLTETDPNYCLAAEEYLLKNYRERIFMLWQCHGTVVVGKHQNALAEVDFRYVRENGIRICRRISGGGTVYHDSGNVNFSLIERVRGPQEISFARFTAPVVEFLKYHGIDAVASGRNDLLVSGKKVSGNAQHVYKNRVLHHGTLLFSSDLEKLGKALHALPGRYRDRAVASNRSSVTNLAGHFPRPMTTAEFIGELLEFRLRNTPESRRFEIPAADDRAIRELSAQKFETREWQFGYSPHYEFAHDTRIGQASFRVFLQAEKGIIRQAALSGEFRSPKEMKRLEAHLAGKFHLPEGIGEAYRNAGMELTDEELYSYF